MRAREGGLGAPATGSPLSFAMGYLARHRAAFAAALVWSVLFVLLPMQVPFLTAALVNGITGQSASFFGLVVLADPHQIVLAAVAGLVLVAAGLGATAYLSTAAVAELSRTTVASLRKDIVRQLDRASLDVHARFGPGELLSRLVVDTQSVRDFVESVFFNTLQNGVRVVYPVAMLFLLDPTVGLVASAVLPVQWLITRRLQAKLRVATRVARTTQGRLTASAKENLDGIETVQSSDAEEFAIRGIWAETDRLARDQISARTYSGLISGSTWALASFGLALTWWLGGSEVLAGHLSLGTLVALTGFVALLYIPMQRFTSVANVYQKGAVALERIQEVLAAPSAVAEDPRLPPLSISAGRIEVRDVWFAYRERAVLRGVNLVVEPGSVTAIVGRNGSGKSTLLKLFDRLYDPTQGSVSVDGQDLRSVRLSSVRSRVALVPQSPSIFSGSFRDNLRLGRPEATDTEILDACRAAGAGDLLARLPSGLDSPLGVGGTRLSGGETQRLAIARALLRGPRILLLDEPNSALDRDSEAVLAETLRRLGGRMTVVLVGHHLGGLARHVDRFVVLESGRVAREPTGRIRGEGRLATADVVAPGVASMT